MPLGFLPAFELDFSALLEDLEDLVAVFDPEALDLAAEREVDLADFSPADAVVLDDLLDFFSDWSANTLSMRQLCGMNRTRSSKHGPE